MRIFRNRLFLSGVCFVLSGLLAFGIVPKLYEDKSATQSIVKVNKAVLAGTKIEETDLIEVSVGAYGLPDSVMKDKKTLVGKYAKTDLYPNSTFAHQ